MFKKTFILALLLATLSEARRDRTERSTDETVVGRRGGRGGRSGRGGGGRGGGGGGRGGRGGRGGGGDTDDQEGDQEPLDPTDDTERDGVIVTQSGTQQSSVDTVEDDDDSTTMRARFVEWIMKVGKDYRNNEQFMERVKNWKENNAEIRNWNKQAEASGNPNAVRLAHNQNSDLSKDEIKGKLGLVEVDGGRRMLNVEGHEQRILSSLGTAVDHSAATAPVADQGQCGSCWSFAGNTTITGTKRLVDPSTPSYPELSYQMPVDCFLNTSANSSKLPSGTNLGGAYLYGCGGGHQERLWDLYRTTGVMTETDYPYVSGSNGGYETACLYDSTKVTFDVTGRGSAGSTSQSIRDSLEDRPLTFAVAVHERDFAFYESGVITSTDGLCSSQLNHAMVIVGYEPGDGSSTTETTTEKYCRRARWYDRYYRGGCMWSDETREGRNCCWFEETETTVVSDAAYWRIQNSWGTGWGESGFGKYAVEGGDGVCGFNVDVDYVTVSGE